MPLMHSERLEVHEKAYPLFQSNADSQKEDPEFYEFLQRTVMFEVSHDYKLDKLTFFLGSKLIICCIIREPE